MEYSTVNPQKKEYVTNTKTVAVIGLGYIGLPTAMALAGVGHRILGAGTNPGRVQAVNADRVPFLRPGSGEALQRVRAARLITTSEQAAPADVYIASVPTPFQGDRHTDLSFVMAVVDEIFPCVSKGTLAILESTSPPGATEAMNEHVEHNRPDLAGNLLFAHCPERMLPGKIMVEIFTNDRVVGGPTPEATQVAQELYASFYRGQIRLAGTRTAELSKLAENSLRNMSITFANELTKICGYLGIDVWELIDLVNLHPRVNVLRPGPGVGGHCIAVDPWFITDMTPSLARLTHTAREVDNSRLDDVVAQAQTLIHEMRTENAGQPTKIAVLGLAFKPDVDDLRSSPAITVANKLAGLGKIELLVCELNTATLSLILTRHSNIRRVELAEGLRDADLVVGLVAHCQFRVLSRDSLTIPVLDACGIWR